MEPVLLSLAIFLAVLICLLAIPLSLSISINRKQKLCANAHFHWLFGLVTFQANIPGVTQPVPSLLIAKDPQSKSKKTTSKKHSLLILIKQPQFRQHIFKFISNFLRTTHAKDLYVRLRIGLGDPADTGMLWAVLGPLSGMLNNFHSARVEIEPEFIDSIMEIESHGQFKLIPLQLIVLLIIFVFSPMTIRAWHATRQIPR